MARIAVHTDDLSRIAKFYGGLLRDHDVRVDYFGSLPLPSVREALAHQGFQAANIHGTMDSGLSADLHIASCLNGNLGTLMELLPEGKTVVVPMNTQNIADALKYNIPTVLGYVLEDHVKRLGF